MVEWLYQHGQDADQPESHYPIRKLKPRALARMLLRLDPSLVALAADTNAVELVYPLEGLGLRLYCHERGVIVEFPYMGGGLARIALGIVYTYIRFLYDHAGFWSYDPQLNVISYADDFQSLEEAAALMDALLPKLLR